MTDSVSDNLRACHAARWSPRRGARGLRGHESMWVGSAVVGGEEGGGGGGGIIFRCYWITITALRIDVI